MTVLNKDSVKFKINKYFYVIMVICSITGYIKEILLLFIFVSGHELCHALFAYIFKLKVKEIELLPFGGVARIDNLEYVGALKEIIIVIAGPIFNFISAIFLFVLNKNGILIPNYDFIFKINIELALFNLLPGIPLDGGRILRALLSEFIGYRKATRTTIISGKILSVLLFVSGIILLFYGKINLGLLIMPFFILFAGQMEENYLAYTIIKNMINKKQLIKSNGAMETIQICAYEDTNITLILKYFEFNKYHIIIIINSSMEIDSILTESQIIDNLYIDDNIITLGQLSRKINKQHQ